MSPWNYPFLLTIDPLIDAIASGNTAVIKPSAYAPHTGALLKKILEECFSSEYVTVVTGGRTENTSLLNEHFDHIFFTGSQSVGKEVMRHAAEHLTPVTLELGGKSPCTVSYTHLDVYKRQVHTHAYFFDNHNNIPVLHSVLAFRSIYTLAPQYKLLFLHIRHTILFH